MIRRVDDLNLDLTEGEFMVLWAKRFVRADGTLRAPIMRVLSAFGIIRRGQEANLPVYVGDR